MSTANYNYVQPVVMGDPTGQATAYLINRTYNDGQPDQYKRELVRNAIEAGATEIRATAIRLSSFGDKGGFKAAFVDNGSGMVGDKLEDHLGSLLNGAGEVGPEGNMHLGARTSTLSWNPLGVLWVSITEEEPEGAMIHIAYNEAKKCYSMVGFPNEDGTESVVGIPPEELIHPIMRKAGHGTAVILLGSKPEDHTVGTVTRRSNGGPGLSFVYPKVRESLEVDWHYYNAKFNKLPEDVTLRMMWGNTKVSTRWMKDHAPGQWYEDADGYGFRTHQGVQGILETVGLDKRTDSPTKGKVINRAQWTTVPVRSRRGYPATVTVGLFEHGWFDRPSEGSGGGSDPRDFGIPLGLFGEKFHEEIYGVESGQQSRALMERYGMVRSDLRNHMVLVVEPGKASPAFVGAEPDNSRRRLMIANNPMPHDEWGEDFQAKMPGFIEERLRLLSGQDSDDVESLLKKMKDRLTRFFTRPKPVTEDTAPKLGDTSVDADGATGPGDDDEAPGQTTNVGSGTACPEGCTCGKHHPGPKVNHPEHGGSITGARGRKAVIGSISAKNTATLPKVEWDETGEEFQDDLAGMLVHWTGGQPGTVYVNGTHPYLKEVIRLEQVSRPKAKSEEVAKLIKGAIRGYLGTHVMAVRGYTHSELVPAGTAADKKFTARALDDVALSATLLNLPYLEAVIRRPFQGKTGFGLADEAAA